MSEVIPGSTGEGLNSSTDNSFNSSVDTPTTPVTHPSLSHSTPSSLSSRNLTRCLPEGSTPLSSLTMQKRRSSTRSIKRKKFDDELVESSLIKSDRGRLKGPTDIKIEPMTPEIPAPVAPPPEKKKVVVFWSSS